MADKHKRNHSSRLATALKTLFLVAAVPLVFALWIKWPQIVTAVADPAPAGTTNYQEYLGQWGDMFGALNTLFAGLGFIFLALTLYYQRADLQETRAEVQEGIKTAKAQQFEASFFQLLNTFNSIIESLSKQEAEPGFNRDSVVISKSGREFLKEEARQLASNISIWHSVAKVKGGNRQLEKSALAEGAKECYMNFYDTRDVYLAHYFRTMYRILRWVDGAPSENRMFYAKILRAQLSSPELLILMFNCLGEYGHKMKDRVEEYGLLKHVVLPEDLRPFALLFKPSAFGDGPVTGIGPGPRPEN